MTTKEDNNQNIEIAEIKKDIGYLKTSLDKNFLQHDKDFYPLKLKFY